MMNAPADTPRPKFRRWLETAVALVAISGGISGGSIWLYQSVRDAAVKGALIPMRVDRLEATDKEQEKRITDLEKLAAESITDRAALRREGAESRAALVGSIKDLAESLNRRLDRLDDKTEKISERVGVGR